MPKFGLKSKSKLALVHSDLQIVMETVVKDYDITILCGYRPQYEQEQAYALKRSRARWLQSPHNYNPSYAVDVAPWINGGLPLLHGEWDKDQFVYMGGIVIATARRLGIDVTWGGDWDKDQYIIRDQQLADLPHFELTKWKELRNG